MPGMDSIDELIGRLEELPEHMQKFSEGLMNGNDVENLMSDMNQDQMYAGKRADGSDITPEYKSRTIALKRRKGQVIDRVTLKDTGDFYRGLRVKVFTDKAEIQGTDEKTADLMAKYGWNILGLSLNNIIRLREFLRPRIIQEGRRLILG